MNDSCAGSDSAIDGTALHTVFGKLHGLLVGTLGNRNALHAHAKTRRVHHDEHVFQATVFLTDQVAHGTGSGAVYIFRRRAVAKLQHSRRAGFDAHFVLDADAMHIIARSQRAIFVHHEFRHHKQADALHTLRRTDHARQHQVDDILGHVVLAPGDENFGTEHFVAAVSLRLCAGAHRCQIAASLRLGQVHGACPFAADQVFQVNSF